jgi:hypothetical protein
MKEKKNPTPHHGSGTRLAHTIYQKCMRLVVVKLFSAKNSEKTHQRDVRSALYITRVVTREKRKSLSICYKLHEI